MRLTKSLLYCLVIGGLLSAELSACTWLPDKTWVGDPIEEWLEIPGARATVTGVSGPDEQGRTTVAVTLDKNCHFVWYVDAQGVIIGWRAKNHECRTRVNVLRT
jgi:hypothetical protein